ncbi:MAG TPA: ABC transporter permease [Gaiellaceae bacterium]|nr:ABC transporter permease [Gaiellaceae bacterium]
MTDATAPTPDERLIATSLASRLIARPDIGAFLAALAVFGLFAAFAHDAGWIGWADAAQWTDQSAQYGIVAVPVALLMIGGEFDLSAGVMIGSSGLLLGLLGTRAHLDIWPSILLVLLFGAAVGLINGITVVKTRLPSFIVTLGTFFILQGVNAAGTLKITGTVAIENIDSTPGFESAYRLFSSTVWSPYDFKVKVIWWIAITAVGAWVLARTRFGNWIYAVGGDPVAARNVGVPVVRTKIVLFVLTSTTSALLGVIEALELRSTQANEGVGREFIFIIAAVVGGCLLTGGYGSVVGTAFGSAILGMASIGIILAGWDSNWTFTFLGTILVLAVLMNAAFRARAARARVR